MQCLRKSGGRPGTWAPAGKPIGGPWKRSTRSEFSNNTEVPKADVDTKRSSLSGISVRSHNIGPVIVSEKVDSGVDGV